MGLIDLITSKMSSDIARHKATKAEADAKIASINTLQGLADLIQEKMKPGPEAMTIGQGPDVSAAPSEDTTLMGKSAPLQVNPSLVPTVTPGSPGLTSGNKLLDMIMPALARSGDVGNLAKVAEFAADPKRQMFQNLFGGPVNMQPGQGGQQPAGNDMIGDIVNKAAQGDKVALSQLATLKMAGFDLANIVERAQKANEPIKRTIYDPDTGLTYEALYKRQGAEEIPGTRNLIKREEVQWIEEAIPGGGTIKVPYRGTQRVELQPGSSKQTPPAPGQTNLKPVDIALPPGATQTDVDKVVDSVSNVGKRGGVLTKYPESQVEIPSADLSLWVNPETLQEAQSGMTPTQAKQAGFKRLSTQAKQSIDSLKSALVVQEQVKGLMAKVFPSKDESIISPQRLLRPLSAMMQTDPDATALFNLVNGTLAPTVRSLGEKGNLSDNDMKRAQGLSIKSTDTAQVAWKRIDTLIELISKIQKSVFVGGYKNLPKEGKSPSLDLGKKDVKFMSDAELLKELGK
jgi:hypothetical protein